MEIRKGECLPIVYTKDYKMSCGKIAHCLAMTMCGQMIHNTTFFTGKGQFIPYREVMEVNIEWTKDLAKELRKQYKKTIKEAIKVFKEKTDGTTNKRGNKESKVSSRKEKQGDEGKEETLP